MLGYHKAHGRHRGSRPSSRPSLKTLTGCRSFVCVSFSLALLSSSSLVNCSFMDAIDGVSSSFISSLKTPGTTNIALVPASPDCWLEAMQVLKSRHESLFLESEHLTATNPDKNDSYKDIDTMTCRWMTSDDQKVLALELSKCHMEDIGRPLFQFQDRDQRIACSRVIYEYDVASSRETVRTNDDGASHREEKKEYPRSVASNCLVHLTDSGVATYTHFFSYVNELCTRLLSETMLSMYRQTSYQLEKSSKIAESKVQALIEQQDFLIHRWNKREEHVLRVYDELESRVQEQSYSIQSEIESLHSMLENERRLRNDEYKDYRETLAQELEKYREEFTVFSFIKRRGRGFMQLWYIGKNLVTSGLRTIHFLFQGIICNICGFFLAYFLTVPAIFRWMRLYMFSVILLSSSIKICGSWFSNNEDQGKFWFFTSSGSPDSLYTNCLYAICNIYLFGILLSVFSCHGHTEGQISDGEEHPGTCKESTAEGIIEQSALSSNQFGQARGSIIPVGTLHQNNAFVPFSSQGPSGAAAYSNLFFGAHDGLRSHSIEDQYASHQRHYWLMHYVVTPPPPIGSRASPIIIESNDESKRNETGSKSYNEDHEAGGN